MIRGETRQKKFMRWRNTFCAWWIVFKKRCRIFLLTCVVLGYISAYFSLASNSTYIPTGEVTYVDRHNGSDTSAVEQTQTVSLYESRLSEIERVAASISRVHRPAHPSQWCIDSRLKFDQNPGEPMGLCYLKIPHAAGATLKGINMRISRNFGQRHGMENCIRHDSIGKGMDFLERHMKSFLWTFVRDPKRRAMSAVGSKLSNQLIQSNKTFFYASNETNNDRLVNSALHLLHNDTDIRDGILSEGRGGFQLQFLMQDYIPHNVVNKPLRPTKIDRYEVAHFVKSNFGMYDFVGVVERFDESLVVMQLLLGLETSDILYFAVNRKEQWRKARFSRKKYVCRDSFDWEVDLVEEPSIREYLAQSKVWYAKNFADYLLYHAASKSLDKTIEKIGSEYFAEELKKFRALKKRADEECSPIFSCGLDGTAQFEEADYDCLSEGKIGCGYRCLDGLST